MNREEPSGDVGQPSARIPRVVRREELSSARPRDVDPGPGVARAARVERAALLGSVAAFLAVASAAALSTLDEIVRWPALVMFFVALALAMWARRVLGDQPRDR